MSLSFLDQLINRSYDVYGPPHTRTIIYTKFSFSLICGKHIHCSGKMTHLTLLVNMD